MMVAEQRGRVMWICHAGAGMRKRDSKARVEVRRARVRWFLRAGWAGKRMGRGRVAFLMPHHFRRSRLAQPWAALLASKSEEWRLF